MKKIVIALSLLLLLTCCVDQKENTTTTTTTTYVTTTSSSTTTSTTTTSSTTTTIAENDQACSQGCVDSGYLGGTCRKTRFECEVRLEKKLETRRICPDRIFSTCCCQTNESVDKNVTIRYNLP